VALFSFVAQAASLSGCELRDGPYRRQPMSIRRRVSDCRHFAISAAGIQRKPGIHFGEVLAERFISIISFRHGHAAFLSFRGRAPASFTFTATARQIFSRLLLFTMPRMPRNTYGPVSASNSRRSSPTLLRFTHGRHLFITGALNALRRGLARRSHRASSSISSILIDDRISIAASKVISIIDDYRRFLFATIISDD